MIALKKLLTLSFGGVVRVRLFVEILAKCFLVFGICVINSHHAVLIIFAFDIKLSPTLLLLLLKASLWVLIDQALHPVNHRLLVYLHEPMKWKQLLDPNFFEIKR